MPSKKQLNKKMNFGQYSEKTVKEIIDLPDDIEPVPDTAPFIKGLFALRGDVIPILDLKLRFSFKESITPIETPKVIIAQEGGARTGFIVDDIKQVIVVNTLEIQPAPGALDSLGEKYIDGIIKEENGNIIVILDLKVSLTFEVSDQDSPLL